MRCALPDGRGEVVFDDVNFAYDGGNPVLESIKLRIRPGQLVALVGATGSGKTTLVSLIPRFYDVSAGSVRIDGCDVRDLTLDELRRNVSLIFQETFLFSASDPRKHRLRPPRRDARGRRRVRKGRAGARVHHGPSRRATTRLSASEA